MCERLRGGPVNVRGNQASCQVELLVVNSDNYVDLPDKICTVTILTLATGLGLGQCSKSLVGFCSANMLDNDFARQHDRC